MPTVTEKKPEPAEHRGRYPKEFRRDVAALVLDQHRTVADVAREMELVEQTVGNWVHQEHVDRGEREGLTTRNARSSPSFARENRQLRIERDLLKKATAFWVKESDR